MRIILICVLILNMEAWQVLLQKGNYSFNQEQWLHAEESYHQAIECIEQYWLIDIENIPLLLAWVSAFHNLAVLYEVQGKAKVAFRYLQIPHQRIAEFCQEQGYSEDFNLVTLRLLKITLAPLIAFSKKHRACKSCLESIHKIEMAVNAQQPVIH